jgi:predicted dinucleotide-binding enzyme
VIYTVIGLCEEQRHAIWIDARNPKEAEKRAVKKHDTETSYSLTVAAVVEGAVKCVDEG